MPAYPRPRPRPRPCAMRSDETNDTVTTTASASRRTITPSVSADCATHVPPKRAEILGKNAKTRVQVPAPGQTTAHDFGRFLLDDQVDRGARLEREASAAGGDDLHVGTFLLKA